MSYVAFSAEPDEADIKRLTKALERAGANVGRGVRNVLNRVGRQARKDIVARLRATYAFQEGFRLGDIELHLATPANLSVYMTKTGRSRTLKEYKFRETKKGIKANILKGKSTVLLASQGRHHAWMGTGGGIEGLIAQRRSPDRMDIRVPHGPAYSKMMEMVWTGKRAGAPMGPEVTRHLHAEALAEIKKLI